MGHMCVQSQLGSSAVPGEDLDSPAQESKTSLLGGLLGWSRAGNWLEVTAILLPPGCGELRWGYGCPAAPAGASSCTAQRG